MRLTDFCHPIELRVPVPRAFPTRYRDFRRVGTPRSLWLHAVLPGEGEFHASLIRFGGSFRDTTGCREVFSGRPRLFGHLAMIVCSERGRCLPTVPGIRSSL